MRPDELHQLFLDSFIKVLREKNLSEEQLIKLPDVVDETLPKIIDDTANRLYEILNNNAPKMLKKRKQCFNDFHTKHFKLWKEGLDLLESFLVVVFEVGDNFNFHYRDEAARTQDYLFDALTRLHARSVNVALEVLNLLTFGFADGAHARWRTVHEIAVVSNFLAKFGNDVAQQYLEHDITESYRAIIQFQKYADVIGYEKYSDQEIDEKKKVYNDLCTKYGKLFSSEYGWAAEALNIKKPNFIDIEKASGLDSLRPYYKMASYNVHANTKGIKFKLGLPEGQPTLLAGPSMYGLTDPAHGVSISVLQATVPMLNLHTNLDVLVKEKILQRYVDDIGITFLSVDNYMKEYDKSNKK